MQLRTRCQLSFNLSVPTPFILMLRPRSGNQQWITREIFRLNPMVRVVEFSDSYGNLCQRLTAPPGLFSIHTSAEVVIAEQMATAPGSPFVSPEFLPAETLMYLYPSRYCESDRFGDLALDITYGQIMGYDQVQAIEDWLRNNIAYLPGTSAVPISAAEVKQRGSGVCRDLSHLGIALCRSLAIPARMVVGYLHGLEPMDMHAWFEAYVNDRWYTFDATQHGKKAGYVAVGYGRDAADVSIYTQFGPSVLPEYQVVQIEKVRG